MISRLYLFRALTVGWMTLIFFLSAQPSLPIVSLFYGADLLAHVAFYGVLCVLLVRSLVPPQVRTWKRVLILTILVIAYGVTDEYHQSFVAGRDASAWDILADGTGGFLVAVALFWRDRRTIKISQFILPSERKRA